MSQQDLQACIDSHLEMAARAYQLDNELGSHHGLSWADFVLLMVLDAAGGSAASAQLARSLHTPVSQLVLRLLLVLLVSLLVQLVHPHSPYS